MQTASKKAVSRILTIGCLAGLLGLGAASVPLPLGAQIYKTVDEDGNVIFTDVPPRPEQNADTVELSSGNTFSPSDTAEAPPPSVTWSVDAEVEEDEAASVGYDSLRVLSPEHDETVRDNAGNVTIAASLAPELRPGHRLQLEMDGQIVQTSSRPSFALQYVDRGTHEVRVHVVNQAGDILMSSEPSVFHLLRYSKLTAPNAAGKRGAGGG